MKPFLCAVLCVSLIASAQEPPLTVVVPKGRVVNIVEVEVKAGTNGATELVPQRPIMPMSATIREMMRKPRPGTQRFQAIKVEERTPPADEDTPAFTTNYVVTWMPIPDGTNPPITWGAVKARTFHTESRWPTKKGDEWEFVPVP